MDILAALYSMSGLAFGAAFVPQIMTLLKDRSGATSTSLAMWIVFALCSLITLLYACTHSRDALFIFCSAVGAVGNMMVLILASTRRLQFRSLGKVTLISSFMSR